MPFLEDSYRNDNMEWRGGNFDSLTVIIATKDRAHELETISLPSLARQDTRDFEVIVWDASKDDRSEQVVRRFAAEHPGIPIRYFRAPRVGTCAQRNDAVKEARGDIIFFIDDDCEVSPDGVAALCAGFRENPEAAGGALPLISLQGPDAPKAKGKPWTWYFTKYYAPLFALSPWRFQPKMLASGAWWSALDRPGEVDHLMGCDMAFRKETVQQHHLNEAMQRLTPYALYEDVEYSHRVWRHGHRLFIMQQGSLVHHRAGGKRAQTSAVEYALGIYNRYLVWRYAIFPFQKSSLFAYLWSALGEAGFRSLQYLKNPAGRGDLLRGTLQGYWAVLRDFASLRKNQKASGWRDC